MRDPTTWTLVPFMILTLGALVALWIMVWIMNR